MITLHLWGVNSSEAFLSFFLLLILIDPFLPVDLNVLIFLFVFGKSGPEFFWFVLFNEGEKQMEASFGPFGLLFVDFLEEFKCEGIFFGVTFSLECDGGWCEIDLFVLDVLKLNFKEYSVFSLGPLD